MCILLFGKLLEPPAEPCSFSCNCRNIAKLFAYRGAVKTRGAGGCLVVGTGSSRAPPHGGLCRRGAAGGEVPEGRGAPPRLSILSASCPCVARCTWLGP